MYGNNIIFQILRVLSMFSAGIALFLAGDVFWNGGGVVDYTSVCAFGVTACALGILARIEQAALYNTSTSTPESKPNIPNTRPRIGPPPRIDTQPRSAICRKCSSTIQPEENFCKNCGWERLLKN